MTVVVYGIVIAAFLLAAGVVIWDRRRTKQTMERLNAMVDRALAGTFTEDSYDESLLSALEAKLARYLAASAVTAGKVQGEKDRIKSLISDIAHQTRTPFLHGCLHARYPEVAQPAPDVDLILLHLLNRHLCASARTIAVA